MPGIIPSSTLSRRPPKPAAALLARCSPAPPDRSVRCILPAPAKPRRISRCHWKPASTTAASIPRNRSAGTATSSRVRWQLAHRLPEVSSAPGRQVREARRHRAHLPHAPRRRRRCREIRRALRQPPHHSPQGVIRSACRRAGDRGFRSRGSRAWFPGHLHSRPYARPHVPAGRKPVPVHRRPSLVEPYAAQPQCRPRRLLVFVGGADALHGRADALHLRVGTARTRGACETAAGRDANSACQTVGANALLILPQFIHYRGQPLGAIQICQALLLG